MGHAAEAKRTEEPHDPTVREFLPWHVVRQKLAARGVVVKDDDPPSGVRLNEKARETAVAAPDLAGDEGLSFKVYTVAELDRRLGDSPPAIIRPSISAVTAQPKPPSPWIPVRRALVAVLYAAKSWTLMDRNSRPALRDALRAPCVVLVHDLRPALASVEWKRHAIAAGAGVVAVIVLLFAVLTVAELTDDLKPARADGATTMILPPQAAPSDGTIAPAKTVAAQPVVVATAAQAAAAPGDTFNPAEPAEAIELDEPASAAALPAKPPARPAKKQVTKKKPQGKIDPFVP